jgi:hypothetical protein
MSSNGCIVVFEDRDLRRRQEDHHQDLRIERLAPFRRKRGTPSRDTHAPFLLSHVTFAASCVSCYAKDPFQELMMNTSVIRDDVRIFDVIILGGGYAGLMAALRLGRKKQTLRIALINASDQFLERVRLQESIVSEVERRIPSISALLRVHLRPNRIP